MDAHKKVVKTVCYNYEEVSETESENSNKLIAKAFENPKEIYKV